MSMTNPGASSHTALIEEGRAVAGAASNSRTARQQCLRLREPSVILQRAEQRVSAKNISGRIAGQRAAVGVQNQIITLRIQRA